MGALAGLTARHGVATKWTAIPVVMLPCVAGLLAARRFSVWFGLAPVPWLLKNWYLAATPSTRCGQKSPYWNAEQAAVFAEKHYAHGFTQFFERAWQYSFAENGASPVLLMTAPLALLLIRDNNRVRRAVLLFAGRTSVGSR